jgi:glycosyltransferase involved in cell wall biosynthesis
VTPRVSVVTPTRDRHDMVSGALASALGQRGVELEVIVVDDGSNPPVSGELVSDHRLRVARHDTAAGVSAARNTGIEQARAPWIAFLDDDDLWAPDKITSQLNAADAAGAAWAYGGDVTVDDDLRVIAGEPPPSPGEVMADLKFFNSVPAGGSNVIVRADALAEAGPFDPSLKTSEDWDMWIRLARCCGPPAAVSRPLVACRMHRGSASSNMDVVLAEIETIATRYDVPIDRRRHYRWAAWTALRAGRTSKAIVRYLQAAARGDIGALGRIAVVVLKPTVAKRRESPRNEWIAEAEKWIESVSQ